jgi:hypothetical protein
MIEIEESKELENGITNIATSTPSKSIIKTINRNGNKLSLNAIKNNKNNIRNRRDQLNCENDEDKEKFDNPKTRKLTDEECLEQIKEKFPEDKGLTKTFITRKLKKRIMIYRKLDFNNEETYKNVENTIPKKTGPNSYLKVSMDVFNKQEFNLDSSLMYFMKDLFNDYFIVFKEKEERMKIIIAGHITKDIVSFLKIISSQLKENYSVNTIKIKAYAFYEELISEFHKRENVVAKKIDDSEIKEYIQQFEYLAKMRKAYDELKNLKVDY